MLLETEEVRQYYLKKAEEYPLVREAVAGTKTFTGCLDDIITGLKVKSEMPHAEIYETTPLREFMAFIGTLSALSDGELEVKKHYMNAEHMAKYKRHKEQSMFSLGYLAASALSLIAPPFAIMEVYFLVIGALGAGVSGPSLIKGWKARRDPEKAFAQVYEAAQHHDSLIGRCFLLEHFHSSQGRFEETYRILSVGEREAVDEQLSGYLAAGGMPGMDEQQLNGYLGGLLAELTPGS